MTATATQVAGLENKPQRVGQLRVVIVDIVTTAYLAGGGSLTASQLGLSKIYACIVERNVDGTHATYNRSTEKFKLFVAAGTEAADAATGTHRAIFWGV